MMSVGIKELREHLSDYVKKARDGEIVEVTDRGSPVARLVPATDSDDPIELLRARGLIRATPRRTGELPEPAEPVPGTEPLLSAALVEHQ